MNIPKSYEALAADLASEKILSKTLLGQKEAYMMLTNNGRIDLSESKAREDALREELAALLESYEAMRDRKNSIVYLQQRLTVAEQRASDMEKALKRIARPHDCGCLPCTGDCTSKLSLEITVDCMRETAESALNPAADGEGS